MQHTDEVGVAFTILEGQEMLVHGKGRLPHMVAEGETERRCVARIPIGHYEAAEVLKAVFADWGTVTSADVLRVGRHVQGIELARKFDPRLHADDGEDACWPH